jgi:hypothetical protein
MALPALRGEDPGRGMGRGTRLCVTGRDDRKDAYGSRIRMVPVENSPSGMEDEPQKYKKKNCKKNQTRLYCRPSLIGTDSVMMKYRITGRELSTVLLSAKFDQRGVSHQCDPLITLTFHADFGGEKARRR